MKKRRSRLTALSPIWFLGDVKEPTPLFKKSREVDPGSVANLYGLWDWVGMASCMGPMSPVRGHSLRAGPVSRKAGKTKLKTNLK